MPTSPFYGLRPVARPSASSFGHFIKMAAAPKQQSFSFVSPFYGYMKTSTEGTPRSYRPYARWPCDPMKEFVQGLSREKMGWVTGRHEEFYMMKPSYDAHNNHHAMTLVLWTHNVLTRDQRQTASGQDVKDIRSKFSGFRVFAASLVRKIGWRTTALISSKLAGAGGVRAN